MKHNHIEEALLIIAASAFAVHVRNHFMIDNGIYEFTYPFRILAEGEVLQALVYSSPFLFYVLALLIFLRKKEILTIKRKPEAQTKD